MRTSDVSKSTERVYQPLVACSHMLCNIYVLESNNSHDNSLNCTWRLTENCKQTTDRQTDRILETPRRVVGATDYGSRGRAAEPHD